MGDKCVNNNLKDSVDEMFFSQYARSNLYQSRLSNQNVDDSSVTINLNVKHF